MFQSVRKPTVRSWLALVVIACIVPATVMAGALVADFYHRERERLVRDSLATVRAMAFSVDRDLASVEAALLALATSPHLLSDDLESFYWQAKELLRAGIASNVVVSDRSGQQRINTLRPLTDALPQHGNMEQLQRVIATGKPIVSDLYLGGVTRLPVVSVDVPVYRDGLVTYDVSMGIFPDRLARILERQKLPPDWIAAIFDSTGTIVARTHEMQRFLGRKGAPALIQRMGEISEGSLETITVESIPVISVFSRSTVSNWTVAIGIPQSYLTAILWRSVGSIALGIVVLLGASLALAWLVSGRIVRSFGQLVGPALSLGSGERVTIPSLELQEAEELGAAILKASDMLHGARSALEQSEARLRGVIESAMDGIIAVDDSQRIVLFNAAAEAIFGYPRDAMIGTSLSRLLPERYREAHFERVRRFADEGGETRRMGAQRRVSGLRRNGEEFLLEASISTLGMPGERLYTVILRDVTARVHADEALAQSLLDLQQFAFIASHDLKTPLRSISGYAQVLEKEYGARLDAEGIDLLRRSSKAARRLDKLTDDLLAYARLDSQPEPFAAVDCRSVLDEVMQLLSREIQETAAVVQVHDLPTVQGDRSQLVQLFLNLVSNALKYQGERAPRVQIASRAEGADWLFSVSDNGIGIEMKHYERIFEVFKRLHTQQTYPGSGIGLAICRRIVHRHGGRIWVESQPDIGSVFFFTIPPAQR